MNTQKGFVGGLILTIIVVGLAIWALSYFFVLRSSVAEDSKSAGAPSEEWKYEWGFVDLGTDNDGMPHTKVSLNVDGRVYSAGTYLGSCNEVKAGEKGVTGEKADTNEKSRVQCWFAGSGDEIGVFEEGQAQVVKHGELGEGEEGGAPFRGNFKTLLTLTLKMETGE